MGASEKVAHGLPSAVLVVGPQVRVHVQRHSCVCVPEPPGYDLHRQPARMSADAKKCRCAYIPVAVKPAALRAGHQTAFMNEVRTTGPPPRAVKMNPSAPGG